MRSATTRAPEGRLNFNHLHYFHVVVENGSVAAAARELGVTPSTVSEQIKQLEGSLGYRLFDRTGNGLRITNIGKTVQQHAAVIFREGAILRDRLRYYTEERKQLEVGVVTSITTSLAEHVFAALFGLTDVFVRVQSEEPELLSHALLMREIDLLLTNEAITNLEERGLMSEVLERPRMIAVATGELVDKVRSFPFDLGKIPLMHYTSASSYRRDIDSFFLHHGISPIIIGETDDVGTLQTIAEQGLAAAILPDAAARLDSSSLQILGEIPNLHNDIVMVYEPDPASAVLRSAIDVLKGPSTKLLPRAE